MSALARYFVAKGCVVNGYDKTKTILTEALSELGIDIHYEENIDAIPKDVDVVVYTPAIPKNQSELLYYQNNNYQVVKRSDVLQWITENSFNICIAGTHGKTTVTSMIAHILRDSGFGCNAFLGGIASNYNTNFWSSEKNVVVVEADEYERSFLKLIPDVAVITSMDPDHLDIYGTPEEVENAFIQFSKNIKPNGCLVSKYGLKRENELSAYQHYLYSNSNNNASVYATDIKVINGSYVFDVIAETWSISYIDLHMGGLHNIENCIVASAVTYEMGVEPSLILKGLKEYKGVDRRFEIVYRDDKRVYIDDYAHHPEELKRCITSLRHFFPGKKLTGAFQPHLFSRTRDFAEGFAESLSLLDEVLLLEIYPARELPMAGINSQFLLDKISLANKKLVSKEELLQEIKSRDIEVMLTVGAGDIGAMVDDVKKIMEAKSK